MMKLVNTFCLHNIQLLELNDINAWRNAGDEIIDH